MEFGTKTLKIKKKIQSKVTERKKQIQLISGKSCDKNFPRTQRQSKPGIDSYINLGLNFLTQNNSCIHAMRMRF